MLAVEVHNAIELLKLQVKNTYDETLKSIGNNIYRGHSRSISTDIEDKLALFIINLNQEFKVFLDPSIHINKKKHRPDLLIVNSKLEVVAMIEIKANMGWCRNAEGVINNIVSNNDIFAQAGTFKCEFLNNTKYTLNYSRNVNLFLVSLTKGNCSDKNHEHNKEYVKINNVSLFNLFDGRYNSLVNYEIEAFANHIINLY